MKKIFQVALGILTAIGGFVDIGDLVANSETGARFKMSLAWMVIVGVAGICLYAEMAGRVATVTQRPVFDIVRERLGAGLALANLMASFFINFLTVTAEIAGIALPLQLASSVNYLLWIPVAAFLVWLVIWRLKFSILENVFGLMGLALVVLVTIAAGAGLGLTTIDPIKVTEYSIVLAAAALPLTYFPILVVANDPDHMGDKVNSKFSNALAFPYLVLLIIVSLATIPLMIITKAGA